MGCGCNKNRGGVGTAATGGTYRVLVSGKQIYESSSKTAADAVADRFKDAQGNPLATILPPGTPSP